MAVPHPEGAQPPEDDRYAARKEGRASKVNESRRAIALPDGAFLVFSGSRIIRIRDNKADIITSDYREFSHYSTLTVCGADESGSPIVWHSKRYTGNSDTKLSGVIESGKIIEPRGNYALEDLDSAAKPQCINDRLVTLGVVRHGKNNGTSDPAEVKIWGGFNPQTGEKHEAAVSGISPGSVAEGQLNSIRDGKIWTLADHSQVLSIEPDTGKARKEFKLPEHKHKQGGDKCWEQAADWMSIRGNTLYTMGDFMCNPGAGSRRIAAEHHEQQSVQLAHYEAAIPPQHDDRPILETYDLASKNRTERINLPQGQGIYEGVETYPRIIPMLIDLRG